MGNFINELNILYNETKNTNNWEIAIQMHLDTLTKVFQSPLGLAAFWKHIN